MAEKTNQSEAGEGEIRRVPLYTSASALVRFFPEGVVLWLSCLVGFALYWTVLFVLDRAGALEGQSLGCAALLLRANFIAVACLIGMAIVSVLLEAAGWESVPP